MCEVIKYLQPLANKSPQWLYWNYECVLMFQSCLVLLKTADLACFCKTLPCNTVYFYVCEQNKATP